MSTGDYIKVINRGKTWHTVTNGQFDVDTGFIGYSGNIPSQDTGYYYLELSDLQSGAWKYYCSLHPYMQLQIVTPDSSPMPTTRVSKSPIGVPPNPGTGEVWVGLQTYQNFGGPDGAVQVVDAATWRSTVIPNVGNNPHNGWSGTALDTSGAIKNVAVWANWHDVTATVLDADTKIILGSTPVGAANAHVITAPGDPVDRWFVTIMGSNKVQEIEPLRMLGNTEHNRPAISQSAGIQGRPGFSPHGLWFLDDGIHFVTADTLANKASLYSIDDPWEDREGRSGIGCEVDQAGTGGATPLSASIFNRMTPSNHNIAYTNNAGTDDISFYRVDLTPNSKSLERILLDGPFANQHGNLALTDLSATPPRWAHMPIQCVVSPPDADLHGRYLVICNKASMNVSIIALNAEGMPAGVYTFPAGLGAHGVAFGRKLTPQGVAYYAYVTNTFEDYVSVYDLQVLDQMIQLETTGAAPRTFLPGGAKEKVYIEGEAARTLLGRDKGYVPITVFSPDARGNVHVGDLPLARKNRIQRLSYLQEHVYVNLPGYGHIMLDLDVNVSTGAMGVFWRRPVQ